MKKLVVLLSAFLTMTAATLMGQGAQHITSELKDGMILIHYNLSYKFYQVVNISIYVSNDGGNTYVGPLKEVTGDVGQNIKRGNRTISWDFMKEMPFVEETLIFDVSSEITGEKPKSSWFVQYVANPTTYVGFRGGILGIVGYYVEARCNLNVFNSAAYTYKDGKIDFNHPGYYVFSDEKGYSAFSALAGIAYQPARNFYIYLGVGYGKENYMVGVDTYDYDGDVKTANEYAKYDGKCNSGVEVDLGLMLKINRFLLSAGGTTINFKTINWTVGIGICF